MMNVSSTDMIGMAVAAVVLIGCSLWAGGFHRNPKNILAHRNTFFAVSAVFLLISIGSLLFKGFNWGMDFTGGTIIEVGFLNGQSKVAVTSESVRDAIMKLSNEKHMELLDPQVQIEEKSNGANADKDYTKAIIRLGRHGSNVTTAEVNDIAETLDANVGKLYRQPIKSISDEESAAPAASPSGKAPSPAASPSSANPMEAPVNPSAGNASPPATPSAPAGEPGGGAPKASDTSAPTPNGGGQGNPGGEASATPTTAASTTTDAPASPAAAASSPAAGATSDAPAASSPAGGATTEAPAASSPAAGASSEAPATTASPATATSPAGSKSPGAAPRGSGPVSAPAAAGSTTPILSVETIDPIIGRELWINALMALVVALVLQLIYITFRFGNQIRYGVAADIALIHDVVIMAGIYSLVGRQVDSPFLAALLTVIGYSVMDSIVVFDRIRENVRHSRKGNYEEICNASVNQTMSRSVNTVLTVLLTLFALFFFGGETLRNFAFALLVGVTSGAYSSIFIATPAVVMLDEWSKKREDERVQQRRAERAAVSSARAARPDSGAEERNRRRAEEASPLDEDYPSVQDIDAEDAGGRRVPPGARRRKPTTARKRRG
jgi:preprotein translocase SecF subunit